MTQGIQPSSTASFFKVPRSDRALEWHRYLEALAEQAATESGRERCLHPPRMPYPGEALRQLTLIQTLRHWFDRGESLSTSGLCALESFLSRAEKNGILDPKELLAIAGNARLFRELMETIQQHKESLHPLWALIESRTPLDLLAASIFRTFEADGQILASSSRELEELRKQERRTRDQLQQQLESILHAEEVESHLQDAYFTMRNHRYVLPVKSERRSMVPGIIHDVSGSSQTVFIEPHTMIESGNRVAMIRAAIADEEERVLRDLSAQVGEVAHELRLQEEVVVQLDFLVACARLSGKLQATSPVLTPSATGRLHLRQVRHPLLILEAGVSSVIANDILMQPGEQAMIITGPNAGGKTVILKTLGLFAAMVAHGFPLPVSEGAEIPFFAQVLASIGDQQDLARHLSSFSGMIHTIRHILDQAREDSLILLDEIVTDTDPRQGSAIAAAVMEHLLESGAHIIATTHYDLMKALAFSDARIINAGMGFDTDTHRPTYRLHLHVPAPSNAFEIAAAMGLPECILNKARSYMDEGEKQIETILKQLDQALLEAERTRDQLKEQETSLQQRAQELQKKERSFLEDMHTLKEQQLDSLNAELGEARQKARELVRDMQQQPKKAAEAGAALKRLEEAAAARKKALARKQQEDAAITPGCRVFVHYLMREADVLEVYPDSGKVLLAMGHVKLNIDVSEIDVVVAGQRVKGSLAGKRSAATARQTETPMASSNTLDIRGFRVDDALEAVDRFLDQLYQLESDCAFVMHGHGTGVLKKALRNHLRTSPYVSSFEAAAYDEGGDGVTRVRLNQE
jgi:DNA mismatch repair protein MutS2